MKVSFTHIIYLVGQFVNSPWKLFVRMFGLYIMNLWCVCCWFMLIMSLFPGGVKREMSTTGVEFSESDNSSFENNTGQSNCVPRFLEAMHGC